MTNSLFQSIPISSFIYLSIFIFCMGIVGVLVKKNIIIIMGCIELMLNSVNLLLVAFSAYRGDGNGQMFVFFIMVVAAAEVTIGLAIATLLYRNTRSVDVSLFNRLKG